MKTAVTFNVQIRIGDAWLTLDWARNLPAHEAHVVVARENEKGGRMRMVPVG